MIVLTTLYILLKRTFERKKKERKRDTVAVVSIMVSFLNENKNIPIKIRKMKNIIEDTKVTVSRMNLYYNKIIFFSCGTRR